ncbi:MORN repeat-containing protein [Marinobacter sp.]|uniref:MORN repeat-containing protein n=1 Tax=Marinobacter sp. TaxID=50741 RepID=UPI0034A25151
MVDFRPLLFVNALVLMLLVTAGFASVRQEAALPDSLVTEPDQAIEPVRTMEPTPVEPPAPPRAEPFAIAPMPENPTVVALAEPPATMETLSDVQPEPVRQPPTTGKLDAYTTVNFQNGNWIGGVKTGDGTYEDSHGLRYEGHFVDGQFHGQGSLTYPDGRHYEGEFSNGHFHGKGLLRNPSGISIEATFNQGEPYGQVRLTTAAGEIFTARTKEPGVCYRDKSYRATQCPQLKGW